MSRETGKPSARTVVPATSTQPSRATSKDSSIRRISCTTVADTRQRSAALETWSGCSLAEADARATSCSVAGGQGTSDGFSAAQVEHLRTVIRVAEHQRPMGQEEEDPDPVESLVERQRLGSDLCRMPSRHFRVKRRCL